MITSNPEILGGMPVIKGTRVPIARLLYMVSHGKGIYQMMKNYPQVSEETFVRVFEELAERYEEKPKRKE